MSLSLSVQEVYKSFRGQEVLKGVSLEVPRGSMLSIIGPSGSGKTTLLRIINGFVKPDRGRVLIEDEEINYSSGRSLRRIRKKVGMVYQLFNLVERLTVLQNVLVGALGRYDGALESFMMTAGFFPRAEVEKAMEILDYVGLADKAKERADRLSGGQKQRVAIARALMQEPSLLLADEPVANLDPRTGRRIMELFTKINEEKGITVVCVLHHLDYMRDYFQRVVALSEGSVFYDGPVSDLSEDMLAELYKMEEEALV